MKIEHVKGKIYEIIDKNIVNEYIDNGSIGVIFEDSAKDAIYESVKERLSSFLAYMVAKNDKSYDGTSEYEDMYVSDLYKLIESEIQQIITDQCYYGKIRLKMNSNDLVKQIMDDVVKKVTVCPNPEENDHNKKMAVKEETKMKIGTMDKFMSEARTEIARYFKEKCDITDRKMGDKKKEYDIIYAEDVYCVWACKTLQNFKGLFSTDVPDGMYYEVTYNGDKEEMYLDAYKKWENKVIR